MYDLAPHNPYTLSLATPLVAGAGSVGYGVEVARQLGLTSQPAPHGLGALITRTTTLRPIRTHPQIHETPAGLLLADQQANPGVRTVRERFAPLWRNWNLPVIVSVAAEHPAELERLLTELEASEAVRGIELALAASEALTPHAAQSLITAARATTPLPLIARLSGEMATMLAIAEAVVAAGADCLALTDGLPAAVASATGYREGLLYGPAVHPIVLRQLTALAEAVTVPIIAGGGVTNLAAARALLEAGATAVSLDTVLLTDLHAPARWEVCG
ncbi:dihydroorotate dehydrogenase [Candidatus Chloroploca sp. M-50]|uniref:Dihydroorotate dehydrogenase n=1 Tax=Candidatus Chloroploca mongolica TaxID=2528176 RepID=A0ABS4DBY7_9CHLR|nr:dihydroorotate dehydrogenase [Candidatus Chloroploca mongolica]MBP1466963.1 dihydroorotate dehydrogenase [Candidatus Chloroploca mongolica]